MTMTTFVPGTEKLRSLCSFSTGQALPRAAAFLTDLVHDRSFLNSHILPVLEEARRAEGWYMARRWDGTDGSYSLQVFAWPPGTGTRIHDHSSWGAYTVLPGDGGIHRVGNPYGGAAVSVHLYGPRRGEVDGRDYDPSREYVCDRQEDPEDGLPENVVHERPVYGRHREG